MRSFGNDYIYIFLLKSNLSFKGDSRIAPGPRAFPRLPVGKPKSASSNNYNKVAKILPSQKEEPIFRPSNLGYSPSKVVHPKNHTMAWK